MNSSEFKEIVALGHETRGVEFKGPGERTNAHFLGKVAKASLAMANRRDGGVVIIGVEDTGTHLNPVGITDAQANTWNHDDTVAAINAFADPPITLDPRTIRVDYDGTERIFVVIRVSEFQDVPVICKADAQDERNRSVLRRGACYVRSIGRIESSEIPGQTEMRELLDIAVEKGVRRFFRLQQAVMPATPASSVAQDVDALFDEQLGEAE